MTKLQTDLQSAPYFDDYDVSKDYYRVLFRPARAVQTRELAAVQSYLQNQIASFADHVFVEGSVVDGVSVTYIPEQKYVHLVNEFTSNTELSILDLTSNNLLVSASGVRAVPKIVKVGFELQYPDTNRIYLDYLTTGSSNSNVAIQEFQSGEVLSVYKTAQSKLGNLDSNNLLDTISVISSNTATGTAYAVSISDGKIYQKGYFARVLPQTVLVKEFDTNTASRAVGFTTYESIVTEDIDPSLNDNANGTTNYTAPGAHRLKLTPTLVSVDKTTLAANSSFLPIVEFDGGIPVEEHTDPLYSALGEAIEQRTDEESGSYVVKPFSVESVVHASNNSLMYYAVSPGIGYVRGSRVELIGTKRALVERSTSTAEAQSQIVTANFGSYINLKEQVGIFDFDTYARVSLYDAAQTSITDVETSSSAASGNVVGTAVIRGFVHDTGVKGLANTTYRLYITDIRMNSGKSFSTDVKSVYQSGTFGYAKGDIVLEDGKAKIQDASLDSLIFPVGLTNVKRLTDLAGVNDTQYVVRDINSATIQSNGFATFTINTPYAGGSDRLNAGVGTLSDAAESDFNLTLSATGYSANLAGTVSVSTTTVTGVGTSFNTDFYVGQFIRFPDTSDIRRITAIANSTSLTINSTTTASAVGYQRCWPQGSVLNLAGSNGSISVISNTQFSVSTDLSLAGSGSQTVYAQYPLLRTQAVPAKKVAAKDRFVKINCTSNTGGPWNLGLVDVYGVSGIYVGTTYSDTNPNRLDWFDVDAGQRASAYEHASLVIKPQYADKITTSTRILVKLDHFVANTSAGIGFFSSDSYPFRHAGDTANSTNIEIASISTVGGRDVRDVVDFRPQRYNTANSATTAGDATENPTAANTSFASEATGSYIIEPSSNFQADVEYYLARKDVLSLTKDGDLVVRKGVPSVNPRTPFNDDDAMALAKIDVPAFPSLTTREGEQYRRGDISTSISVVSDRRYTMRDIGVLDQRLKRVEYYVTLNLLEQTARDLTIPDASGLNRFKNGIFANPFNSHILGNVGDFEYKVSIDRDKGIARPYFKQHAIDYSYDSNNSTGIQITGTSVSRPYTSEIYITQPYASKFRTCTQSVWGWNGSVDLYPDYDHFRDEQRDPAVNVNVDLTEPWREFANSPFGSVYGDWRTTGTVTQNTTSGRTTTTTTTTTQARSVTGIAVDSVAQRQSFGSYVNDVSINPYMRSREVAFVATGLKPNTNIYAFFDTTNVSAHCAPGALSGLVEVEQGREETFVNRTSDWGTQLVSDSSGTVVGMFRIPAGEFRTGDRVFQLTDVTSLITGDDAKLSSASATYTASSLSVSTNEITLTTQNPKITPTARTERNVVTSSTSRTVNPPSNNGRSNDDGADWSRGAAGFDPIAQSFLVVTPGEVTGTFVDKIGVYFQAKDPTLGVTVYLVQTTSGDPDTSKVVAQKHLTSAEVSVSSDASVETVFDFDNLPFLTNGQFYAFLVKPDGDSPEYRIWLSEVGTNDIATGLQIFSNPYIGVTYISANMNTWTPLQTEDIKFNIYRARFTVGTGTASFINQSDEYLTVDGLTKANSAISVQVGDVVYVSANGVANTSNTSPVGYVQLIDEANDYLMLDTSSGGFAANAAIQIHRPFNGGSNTINSNTLIASTTIESVDDIGYSAIVPRFASIAPSRTSIEIRHRGVDQSFNADGSYATVVGELENEKFDKLRIIGSKSNEDVNGSIKSSIFNLLLTTTSDYVSPIVDLTRKSSIVVENIINDDNTNEHTRYGNALTKYISPLIELEDGQDAEDLLLYVTAHRPPSTDVEVYVKVLNAEDSEDINAKVWSKLRITKGEGVYSATGNPDNYIEYVYGFNADAPVTNAAWVNAGNSNIVEYTNAAGSRFVGYKKLMIKVVMLAETKYVIPTISDVRSISLQV